jgi:hypothetical protein
MAGQGVVDADERTSVRLRAGSLLERFIRNHADERNAAAGWPIRWVASGWSTSTWRGRRPAELDHET